MSTPAYFIQTVSGRLVDLLRPNAADIDIGDIAHALGSIGRFGGHTRRFYSVAEHSVNCSRLAPDGLKLHALLHDAHEAYLGDVCSPLKHLLRKPYIDLCDAFDDAITQALGLRDLTFDEGAELRRIDRVMLATERRELMLPADWGAWEPCEEPTDEVASGYFGLGPDMARELFTAYFERLVQPNPAIETARLSLQAASDSGQKKGESQEDLLKKIFSGTYDGNQVLRELLALLKESA